MKETASKNLTSYYLGTVLLLLLVGGGAFFAGVKFQQSRSPSLNLGGGKMMQRFGGNEVGSQTGGKVVMGRNAGYQPIVGEIISQDETSITVKMQDGSSKIVLLSDTTSVNKTTEGSKSDLTVGTQVNVMGKENSDGSVTAQNVQLDPVRMVNNTPE